MGFIKNLFDSNAKDIKKYEKVVAVINGLEAEIMALSDEALAGCTEEFKAELASGKTLDDILPRAFAVVREASRRVLGMRHFDVQLIGGMTLHDGRIAEMKTGEGKTLVATLPVYLNALSGKGVHVITVNDYLATRDSQTMGKLYSFLGLSVGLVVHGMKSPEKKIAYACDITYGTNNEYGFDYLRDNMSVTTENLVQRKLNYAIVDEVDSILIDEARTPLIISGPSAKPTELYGKMTSVAARLKPEIDYTIDEKLRAVMLTPEGVARVESMTGVENLYDNVNLEVNHHVQQALKAYALFKRDIDYVVKDGEVIIVDEFTGRLMFGRRYSEGLHQAIEAKEGVQIEKESQTLATITFQNYFRMYNKLSGMTGTAITEEDEFLGIYGLDVVVIPTNKPMVRIDHSDSIYRSVPAKYRAVVEEIAERHTIGQPVLVGTISIERSELLSKMLKQRGIPHNVLNAKFHEQEAAIVAEAGRFGAVTIATNMAGRGTDIVLGGSGEAMLKKELGEAYYELDDAERISRIEALDATVVEDREKVYAAGGLAIIGTERHESRRIDNQLRGRAGRQGDVGSSRFYLSMEDDLMRLFGGDQLSSMMDRLKVEEDTPIDSGMVTRSIEGAQKKVENRNFEIRKNVLNYDDVMNQQREVIYKQRFDVLRGEDLHDQIVAMITDTVAGFMEKYIATSQFPEEWDLPALQTDLVVALPNLVIDAEEIKNLTPEEVTALISEQAVAYYDNRRVELGEERFINIERAVILRVVDKMWMSHIDAMDQLRGGIGLRAYGQKNPVIEYRNEAYNMFTEMIAEIKYEVTRIIQRIEFVDKLVERTDLTTNEGMTEGNKPKKRIPVTKAKTLGRNDICDCGSGKKYKNCCGKN